MENVTAIVFVVGVVGLIALLIVNALRFELRAVEGTRALLFRYGKFVRRFTVPPEAENAKVTAEFKDGVLHVHVPKTQVARPKTIEVKVA